MEHVWFLATSGIIWTKRLYNVLYTQKSIEISVEKYYWQCLLTNHILFSYPLHGTCRPTFTTLTFTFLLMFVPFSIFSGQPPPPANCERSQCQVVFVPECPPDSRVQKQTPEPGQCCPDPPTCQCQECFHLDPLEVCPEGQLKVKTHEGQGVPGQCCDVFECQPRGRGYDFESYCRFYKLPCFWMNGVVMIE